MSGLIWVEACRVQATINLVPLAITLARKNCNKWQPSKQIDNESGYDN